MCTDLLCSQLRQRDKGRWICTSVVPACPRALRGLTDTEKQLLLFTCSFCSSGVTVTYFISFSEHFSPQCVTDRVELFKTFASNIHPAAAFLSTQRLSPGPYSYSAGLCCVFVLTKSCIFKSKAYAEALTERGWRAPESKQSFLVAVIIFALHWCGQSG